MGIRGFTTFVDSRNRQLLQSRQLHDARVIIDGNNFFHFLYHYSDVEHQYGGDYDTYYTKVKEIFTAFAKCNITPYVIFDGAYEAASKKLKTILSRAEDRIHLANSLSHGGEGRVLPLLAEDTFKQVLVDLEVPHVICDYEADAEIVVLANEWKCPVMSNDSDFFIFDLKGGFILFDYVDFRMSTKVDDDSGKKTHYLSVQIYHTDNFHKAFREFDINLLPVIAVLLGNDFISSSVFENFLASLQQIQTHSLPKKQRRLLSIIHWLQNFETCLGAIDAILKRLPAKSVEDIRNLTMRCIRYYTEFPCSFSLSKYFEGDKTNASNMIAMTSFCGLSLPYWVVLDHRINTFNNRMLNILISHQIVLLSQIENMKTTSAYSSSLGIRQVTYGILLKDELEGPAKQRIDSHVEEYSRDEYRNLKKTLIEPITELTHSGKLPGLSEIRDVSQDKALEIVLETLSVPKTVVEAFSPALQLLACVIVYWIRHSLPKVPKHHYHAMLLCVILLQAKAVVTQRKRQLNAESLRTDSTSTEDSDSNKLTESESQAAKNQSKTDESLICVHSACEQCSDQELADAVDRLSKFHGKVKESVSGKVIEAYTLHTSAQFQACFQDSINLNKLLLSPLLSPLPHQFFSGSFLYNFTKNLRSRTKPLLFIRETLGPSSPLTEVFEKMDSILTKDLESGSFQEGSFEGGKNSKKQARKKAKKLAKLSRAAAAGGSSDSDSDTESVEAFCDLDNRFSSLLLVED